MQRNKKTSSLEESNPAASIKSILHLRLYSKLHFQLKLRMIISSPQHTPELTIKDHRQHNVLDPNSGHHPLIINQFLSVSIFQSPHWTSETTHRLDRLVLPWWGVVRVTQANFDDEIGVMPAVKVGKNPM